MLVVDAHAVGRVAFERMSREHLVHEIVGSRALPTDVQSTRAIRLHLISPFVPGHTWVTGLGALWIEGLTSVPRVFDLVGGRGVHKTVPLAGSPRLDFHAGGPRGLDREPTHPRIAHVTRSCIDALTFSGATTALPAVASAVREGATTTRELFDFAWATDIHTPSRPRVLSLVEVLEGVLPRAG